MHETDLCASGWRAGAELHHRGLRARARFDPGTHANIDADPVAHRHRAGPAAARSARLAQKAKKKAPVNNLRRITERPFFRYTDYGPKAGSSSMLTTTNRDGAISLAGSSLPQRLGPLRGLSDGVTGDF